MIRTTRSNNIQRRNKKQTRRHKYSRRQYKGGGNPVHFVGAVTEAYHVQHSFFALLSLATQNKSLNLLSLAGLTTAGAVSIASTAGLAIVGLGIVIFTAMAIRESINAQNKLHRTVTELIRVLRKIQKTMMLCLTMSAQYNIVINTHDLNGCLSKIYASLNELLTDDARKVVETYALNYKSESPKFDVEADNIAESNAHAQHSTSIRVFFSNIGQSIARSYRKWFKSDAKEQELRELMNELTPFLTLLLSQTVLQFMVCQTSMITEGKTAELQIGNDAVKVSCQYKDFQLSALLDSIMRIRGDLDREPANRSHIRALTNEVNRIRDIVKTNTNYASFDVLQVNLDKLYRLIEAGDYDNVRVALNDLNTYDEQAFLKECNSQSQTVSVGKSTQSETSASESSADRSSISPKNPGESSDPLLLDINKIDVGIADDDEVYSRGSNLPPHTRTKSGSSTSSVGSAVSVSPRHPSHLSDVS